MSTPAQSEFVDSRGEGGQPQLLGAVLAGGESRRLGRPKALVEFAGIPMASLAVDALAGSCSPVVVITGNESIVRALKVPARPDVRAGEGPLTGIYTALCWAREVGAPGVAILGCDMPFVSAEVVRRLVDAWGSGVLVAAGPSGREPLCGVYGVEVMEVIERRRKEGKWSVQGCLTEVEARFTPAELLRGLGTHEEVFFNVNTQAEVEEAEERWRTSRSRICGTDGDVHAS